MPESLNDLDWPAYADEMGRRLATVRKAQRVSQTDLANATGISRTQLQNIERSRSFKGAAGNTTVRTLFLLAQALGVPPELLVPSLTQTPGPGYRAIIDQAWPQIEVELQDLVRRHPLPLSTPTSKRV